MGFQQVGESFTFPHEKKQDKEDMDLEIEGSSAEELDTRPSKKAKVEASEEYEYEIIDDTPPEDRNREPMPEPPSDVTDEELAKYDESIQKRVKKFAKGYHDERRAKEAALREREALEQLARQLRDENEKLKGDVNKSRGAIIEQAKRQVASDLARAKALYKTAYENGDSDKLLKAEEALAQARAREAKLAGIKSPALQSPKTNVKTEQSSTVPSKVESAPTPIQRDERAESWAKENPWFGKDDEMTSFALGLHQKLVKSGIDPKSDAYYENINSRLREVFPDQFGAERGAEPKSAKNVVAPATRSRAPKKVSLTKSQVAIAKRLGVPLELYAKQMAAEMKKGN